MFQWALGDPASDGVEVSVGQAESVANLGDAETDAFRRMVRLASLIGTVLRIGNRAQLGEHGVQLEVCEFL